MTIVINREKALDLLREVVAIKGSDYVYSGAGVIDGCTYTEPDGTPSCIVGHVIAAVSPEALHEIFEHEYAVADAHVGPESFGVFKINDHSTAVRLTEAASEVLQVAQAWQDSGATWGETLAHAVATAGAFASSGDYSDE